MSRRYVAWLVVLTALTTGCSAAAPPTDEPARNATLSSPGYERTASASPAETRTYWDRSKSWEDPGNRTVRVTSRAYAYRNSSGTDTVVVYTTPRKPYVGPDRVRSLSAPALVDLATRSVGDPPPGNDTGSTYRASLFGADVAVRTLTDPRGSATGYVVRVTRDDAIVVVVVIGGVDRSTVERVLDGVTFPDWAASDG